MTTPTFLSGGYVPPGVYIDEQETTVLTSSGLPPQDVAIVGPAIGYETGAQQVTITVDGVALALQGIDLDTLVVTRVDTGAALTLGTDYTSTQSAGSGQDYTVSIARVDGGPITDDIQVIATFQYTEPEYYNPRTLNNYGDVKAIFGEPLALTGPTAGQTDYQPVTSPLSLAAKIAFENGAGELICVPTVPPSNSLTDPAEISNAKRQAISDAYAKISSNYAASIIVPITDGVLDAGTQSAGTDLRTHLEQSSASGYYRIGVLGFDSSVTTAPDQIVSTGNFGSSRLIFAYASPNGMAYYHGAANQILQLGHQYLAAAYAGRLAAIPVQKALTQEQIRSFNGLGGPEVSSSLKNRYAQAGVAITETSRLGILVCRHGLTSAADGDTLHTEASLVRANDYLLQLLQIGTEQAGLIGTAITPDTILSVKSVVAGLLEHATLQGSILSYDGLGARQRPSNLTVIEVQFVYQPAYPINYIAISFSVDTSTGLTDNSTTVTNSGS